MPESLPDQPSTGKGGDGYSASHSRLSGATCSGRSTAGSSSFEVHLDPQSTMLPLLCPSQAVKSALLIAGRVLWIRNTHAADMVIMKTVVPRTKLEAFIWASGIDELEALGKRHCAFFRCCPRKYPGRSENSVAVGIHPVAPLDEDKEQQAAVACVVANVLNYCAATSCFLLSPPIDSGGAMQSNHRATSCCCCLRDQASYSA